MNEGMGKMGFDKAWEAGHAAKPLIDLARGEEAKKMGINEEQKDKMDELAMQVGDEAVKDFKEEQTAENTDTKSENKKETDIEKLRQGLAEEVKINLEKYKDEIKDLAIFTSSAKNGNGFNKTKDLSFAKYNEENDADYEVEGTSKEKAYSMGNIEDPTYIYHKKMNWGSFYAPLGSCLHTPDRTGNMIGISIKGEKGKRFTQELINSILNLIKTIKQSKDLKEIAKEAIPIFEAFKETAERFQTGVGNYFTVQEMINEYKEILKNYEQKS